MNKRKETPAYVGGEIELLRMLRDNPRMRLQVWHGKAKVYNIDTGELWAVPEFAISGLTQMLTLVVKQPESELEIYRYGSAQENDAGDSGSNGTAGSDAGTQGAG